MVDQRGNEELLGRARARPTGTGLKAKDGEDKAGEGGLVGPRRLALPGREALALALLALGDDVARAGDVCVGRGQRGDRVRAAVLEVGDQRQRQQAHQHVLVLGCTLSQR